MKGTITRLVPYKSGKGYFIGIDDKPQDYMFFGSIGEEICLGAYVAFDIGKPAKDGKPTIKSIQADNIEAFEAPTRDEDRAKPVFRAHDVQKLAARDVYWTNKEKRDLEREPIITRLSCISSACVLLHDTGREDDALELAAKFEKFAKGEKP